MSDVDRIHNYSREEKLNYFDRFMFVVSLAYVYAGCINNGVTSFLMAVPFTVVIVLNFTKIKSKAYKIMIALFLVISILLCFLKSENSKLYHPGIGKNIKANTDLCLMKSRMSDDAYFYYFVLYNPSIDCKSTNLNPDDFVEGKLVKKNSLFNVEAVKASTAWFSENYGPVVKTVYGRINLHNSLDHFVWGDGAIIGKRDLIRPILYVPTIILIWPFLLTFYVLLFLYLEREYHFRKEID